MCRLFVKTVFCGCKSQISFIGDQNAGPEDRIADVGRGCEKQCGAWRAFCVSVGSRVHFAGLMAAPCTPLSHEKKTNIEGDD